MKRRLLLRVIGGWCLVWMLLFTAAYVYAGHWQAVVFAWVFGAAGVTMIALSTEDPEDQ